MFKRDYCRIIGAIVEVIARQPGRPAEISPTLAAMLELLIADARRNWLRLAEFRDGPWRVDTSGRWGSPLAPAVYAGDFAFQDHGLATEIAGLLNWCDVPVPQGR